MNQELMLALHAARSKLGDLKEMIHMHMSSNQRFVAERLLEEAMEKLNVMYVQCLQCDDDDRREP